MTSGFGTSRPVGRLRVLTSMFFLSLLLSGCMNNTSTPAPTAIEMTSLPTPSPTFAFPTIVPTATLTPSQIPPATIDPLSGVGGELFNDSFEQNRGWQLSEDEFGATSILGERLIITLREARSFRYAIAPTQPLIDFYLEIEVRPDLCQSDDEFGVLFRVNAQIEHYRFAVNCDGQARVTRVLQDGSRALTPVTHTPSVIAGPMAVNKLALRATGDQFIFWINGVEAFSLRDVSINQGLVGAYVRTGRGNLATVSFDNLLIRELKPSPLPTTTGES